MSQDQHIADWLKKRKERKAALTVENLFEGILNQDVKSLSSAITLVESTLEQDRIKAQELIKKCLPHTGKSIRIGITGVPGVGKSTFIESFGQELVKAGRKVAILAIDPSSGTTGGSILGDKTRMEVLTQMKEVFIRPTAAGTTLGGVATKTRESIYLCEACGFDTILIETVGVGQSETLVHSMVDFFLLLMLAGAGDELQGIKRGIMELADALVITKADGDNVKKANLARREYQNAMHLFPPKKNGWTPKSLTCSSLTNTNIDQIWETIQSFENHCKINGSFDSNRREQDKYWMQETLNDYILRSFYDNEQLTAYLQEMKEELIKGNESSFTAADKLFEAYRKHIQNNGTI
ncbi:MAG TPA: methylmalonyl Co-A mutase-associated GTPase MeaB [Taishania sp.]|nr:methylmalonyl Co-A mutase-associated GTPase MeaB [Taishania sp.]